MTSLSQENLIKLAQEDEAKGNLAGAIDNLREALNMGHSVKIVVLLSQLYRKNKQEDQAYTLLKEEPDLFSEQALFDEYINTLVANHYYIEGMQLEKLLNKKLPLIISPVSDDEQKEIMKGFRQKKSITLSDYQDLFKLNLINFEMFTQSLLIDPTQGFAIRLALCEDLVKLQINKSFKILVLGELEDFIPSKTQLMEKTTIYREVISSVGDRFRNSPTQLPLMLGEANLVLGSLYPKLSQYIKNTDGFTHDLVNYLETKNGGVNQKLLEKIYASLPK